MGAESTLPKIVRILKMFLEELKDIRRRLAILERRVDMLKTRLDTVEASLSHPREKPSVSTLFDVSIEVSEAEEEARKALLEVVELYERSRELRKLGEEIFGE